MKNEELIIKAKDKYKLSCRLFNTKNPKAIILMIHGMEEHKERYYDFAKYLQKNNYVVLISDMRGHGSDAPILSHIADKDGDKRLVEDIDILTKYIKKKYKEKKIYLFAHSMGTIIARKVLQENSKKYDKVVLSGYPVPQKISKIGIRLTNMLISSKGPKEHSKLVTNMALGSFVKAVKNRETDLDWLSYNKANVNNYINDKLCGVDFTLGSFNTLFKLVYDISKPKNYININEDLNILLISGNDDPVTGYKKGRIKSLKVLKKAGFKNIEKIVLEKMRHEILNEKEKDKVYKKILDFYNK